jgi:hypothetical protein
VELRDGGMRLPGQSAKVRPGRHSHGSQQQLATLGVLDRIVM